VTAHSLAIEELERVHEHEIESLRAELASTKEANMVLETKATRLNHALSRQDELENMCITLRRKLDVAEKKVESETEGLKSSLQIARNEVTKKTMQIESLESQNQNLQMAVNKMNLETTTLNDQLISLRYIWDEKSKQTEQMSAMIQSLEKMNKELSQKLNSMQK
jgi:chromosome segregation ATPase